MHYYSGQYYNCFSVPLIAVPLLASTLSNFGRTAQIGIATFVSYTDTLSLEGRC